MSFAFLNDLNEKNVPCTLTEVEGLIINTVASLHVAQTFESKVDSATCTLIFGNDLRIIISNIKVKLGEKVLDFVVEEIPEGEDFFGVAEGKTKLWSDAIHVVIGSLSPEQKCVVTYDVTILAILSPTNELLFPMSLKQNPNKNAGKFNIGVDFFQKFSITSPFIIEDNRIHQDLNFPEGCLQLNVKIDEPLKSSGFISQNYMSLSLLSEYSDASKIKTEYFLVIDCSGSMSGNSIVMARDTLRVFIRSLPYGSLFNVIRFGSTFEGMFQGTVDYKEETFAEALSVTNVLQADLGGTDVLSPLSYIFGLPTKQGYIRQIFLITDGMVEKQSSCIALATKNRRNHRIFSVGIGNDISAEFIQEIAEVTQGTAIFVRPQSDIIAATMGLFESSLIPAVVEPQIHLEGLDSFEISPFPLPSLFKGVLTHAFLKFPSPISSCNVLITGQVGETTVEITFQVLVKNIDVSKAFAYNNIRDMEDRIALSSVDKLKELRAATIQMSNQSGITSQFTRYQTRINGRVATEQEIAELYNFDREFQGMQPNFNSQIGDSRQQSRRQISQFNYQGNSMLPKKMPSQFQYSQTTAPNSILPMSKSQQSQPYSIRQVRNLNNYIRQTSGYEDSPSVVMGWGTNSTIPQRPPSFKGPFSGPPVPSPPQIPSPSPSAQPPPISSPSPSAQPPSVPPPPISSPSPSDQPPSAPSVPQTPPENSYSRNFSHSILPQRRRTVQQQSHQVPSPQTASPQIPPPFEPLNPGQSFASRTQANSILPTRKRDQTKSSLQDPLTQLIDLQSFDGYWANLDKVQELFSVKDFSITIPPSVSPSTDDLQKIKATILALKFFEIKFLDRRIAWISLESKAKRWLEKSFPFLHVELILKNAQITYQ